MKKLKILVTGTVPETGLAALKQICDVTYNPQLTTRAWVLAHLKDYDGLLLMGLAADRELIDAGVNLKIITANGAGFDHIDVVYATKKGIVVTNAPHAVRQPTAEMALALLLNVVRKVDFYDRKMQQGTWVDTNQVVNQGMNLPGKTLGIYGMGKIGQQLAQYAQALGMKIIYHNRHQLSVDQEANFQAQYVDFDTLVQQADVLSLHAPATAETAGIFNAAVFTKMKSTAYFINTARGALVNQSDLAVALSQGQIAGAGLDVFVDEPQVPKDLLKLDNVVLTPHAGTATQEARTATVAEAAHNLILFSQGQTLANQVN
ncbi:NAD(P)-binding domain-containing protein [Bombilactobacillus folatiphilus]|uniref:NAD(P)-binding domain-containing protein n=1 Tax=Bombilactobacillus folatiphilus TaxID=2923362 RepID=A0ABY4P8X3_9LACO|nr:NAD(P)-dependent oxidoreductase [Bombilactobacillus folatiphilus]UQS81981.1 NAD(P)-binding domain-containing protein [Bombilactobacillus folatiphilus]